MPKIRYVGDDEVDNSWAYLDGVGYPGMLWDFLYAVRRARKPWTDSMADDDDILGKKVFQSESEQRKWLRIEKAYEKGKIPDAWIENCLKWCKKMNGMGSHLVIKLPAVMSLILNEAKMNDFIHGKQTGVIREHKE